MITKVEVIFVAKLRGALDETHTQSLRDMLVRALRFYRSDATIVCASNGAEALAACNTQRTDLVITDLFMPLMDGISLMQTIRQRELDIPVVLFSGLPDSRFLKDSGFNAMLSKPFAMDALQRVLDTFLPQTA